LQIQLQSETTLKLLVELQRHLDEFAAKRDAREPRPPASDPIPRIESFDLAPEKKQDRIAHVPAGTFAEGTLLTGILAPVGGDALPVLIKLDALAVGPNRSRLPLKDAFLVGKATGDANSSRAIVQLHLLSYVGPDGRTIERKVNGWVVDADGMQGLKGEYVWNANQIATLSIAAGGMQGMANAFAASQTTVTSSPAGSLREVTGSAKDYTLFQGGGQALANLSKIIEERLREFTPGVFVSNRDRKLTAVFLEGVTLDSNVFEEKSNVERPRNPFSDLDASDRRRK
jgi:conjugal transfer pilus assembly protein TraB